MLFKYMDINKHNYEAYFLDYHEGNLSEEEIGLLKSFLNENPALKEQLDDFDKVFLQPDERIAFPHKKKLKKEDSSHTVTEEHLIALLEGDSDKDEEDKIRKAIAADEDLAKEYSAYAQTISKPDLALNFPNKGSLKKEQAILFTRTRIITLAAAAAILLLIGIPATLFYQGPANISRESISISKTPSLASAFIENEARPEELSNRIVYQAQFSQPVRNNLEIARIESLPPTAVTSQYKDNFTSIAYYREIPLNTFNDPSPGSLADAEDKTLAGKIINGFFNRISSPFKNDQSREVNRSRDFSIWDLAEFGVKGINALGGHDYTLIRQYNENGNVKGVMILEE
jgi:hypothetical protein